MAEAGLIEIYEVGPRDGLQNEPRHIPVAEKVALVDLLSQAGFARIECAAFVSPKWVPQMAGSAEVLARITRVSGLSYVALAPNIKGFEAALAARADEVAIFASASEGFSKANINATISQSLDRFALVADAARAAGLPLRGYVSCAVECPYEGAVAPAAVAQVAAALRALGCHEISLGDTIGRGRPAQVDAMLSAVLEVLPPEVLAGHFHDTAGRALENVDVALGRGLRVFDAAIGGLGGCPYAPGAAGNVATEVLNAHLVSKGYATGLDPKRLNEAAAAARRLQSGPAANRVGQTGVG